VFDVVVCFTDVDVFDVVFLLVEVEFDVFLVNFEVVVFHDHAVLEFVLAEVELVLETGALETDFVQDVAQFVDAQLVALAVGLELVLHAAHAGQDLVQRLLQVRDFGLDGAQLVVDGLHAVVGLLLVVVQVALVVVLHFSDFLAQVAQVVFLLFVYRAHLLQIAFKFPVGVFEVRVEFVHLADLLDFDHSLEFAQVLELLFDLLHVVILLPLHFAFQGLNVVVVVLLEFGHVLQEVQHVLLDLSVFVLHKFGEHDFVLPDLALQGNLVFAEGLTLVFVVFEVSAGLGQVVEIFLEFVVLVLQEGYFLFLLGYFVVQLEYGLLVGFEHGFPLDQHAFEYFVLVLFEFILFDQAVLFLLELLEVLADVGQFGLLLQLVVLVFEFLDAFLAGVEFVADHVEQTLLLVDFLLLDVEQLERVARGLHAFELLLEFLLGVFRVGYFVLELVYLLLLLVVALLYELADLLVGFAFVGLLLVHSYLVIIGFIYGFC